MNDVLSYLPSNLQDDDTLVELVASIQKVMDDNDVEVAHIYEKYRSTGKNTELLLKEFGYDYIYDVLVEGGVDPTELEAVIPLIHYLKGTKEGIVLVLQLLKLGNHVREWWEDWTGAGYGNDYGNNYGAGSSLAVLADGEYGLIIPASATPEAIAAITKFSSSYVLPKLVLFTETLGYGIDYGNNYGQSAIPS